jgi:hypothetical protein
LIAVIALPGLLMLSSSFFAALIHHAATAVVNLRDRLARRA